MITQDADFNRVKSLYAIWTWTPGCENFGEEVCYVCMYVCIYFLCLLAVA